MPKIGSNAPYAVPISGGDRPAREVFRDLTRYLRRQGPTGRAVAKRLELDLVEGRKSTSGTIKTGNSEIHDWLQAVAERGGVDLKTGRSTINRQSLGSVEQLDLTEAWLETALTPEFEPLFGGTASHQRLLQKVRGQIETLEAQKEAATQKAAQAIEGWNQTLWQHSLWRPPEEKEDAINRLAEHDFGRGAKRKLRAAEGRVAALERLIALDAEVAALEAPAVPPALLAQRRSLISQYIDLTTSAGLNDALGLAQQVGQVLSRQGDRFFDNLGKLFGLTRQAKAEASNLVSVPNETDSSKIDPVESSFWERRSAKKASPLRLFFCPWRKPKKAPVVPTAEQTLRLKDFKSLESDGMHPSAEVVDENGKSWKIKLNPPAKISAEPIMTRLFFAMGYETEPTYFVPELTVEPRVVVAAYRSTNRIAGYTPYTPADTVTKVTLTDGTELTGEAAIALCEKAVQKPALLDTMASVTVRGCDLEYKEGKQKSIGPWSFDGLGHDDRRELRAVGLLASWLMGVDFKTNNNRLDMKMDDDGVKLYHVLSDLGNGLQPTTNPESIPTEVPIDPQSPLLHDNKNMFEIRAFDKLTPNDAKWAVRQLAGLTEEQLTAGFAAGNLSWPVTLRYLEKFIARRDDLVEKFGLKDEIGLLRPDGPNEARESYEGEPVVFFDHDEETGEKRIFTIENGQLIEKQPTDA